MDVTQTGNQTNIRYDLPDDLSLPILPSMKYAYPDSVLMIFCKAPEPGQVKTRLMPELTADQAVKVHLELSVRTLELAVRSSLCPIQLWCAPSIEHPFFARAAAAYPLRLKQQRGRDLGERMHNAFRSELIRYSSAVLIGSDCPSFTMPDLTDALSAINGDCDAVLAPAEDGGYVLIGLTKPCWELFGQMPWGTAEVLAQTRKRIRQGGLRYRELKEQWDLDTTEDLLRYRKWLAAIDPT
ncbi:MAG: TIGR04282 family arsenosugar biosynthesis glycosyltransferase [Methylosarcina sp.]